MVDIQPMWDFYGEAEVTFFKLIIQNIIILLQYFQ